MLEPDPMDVSSTELPSEPSNSNSNEPKAKAKPRILVMMGMAGAGKTQFTYQFLQYLRCQGKKAYVINLDPASSDPPFLPNIDIRDTLDYNKVMAEYNLGPNGGIITALNLFATKFHEVLAIIQTRSSQYDYFLVDTPGQSECFLWSSSGPVILQGLGTILPTILIVVVDSVRCRNPVSFVSTGMYGVQVIYKNKLPMVMALNKADVDPSIPILLQTWLSDFDELSKALEEIKNLNAVKASSMALAMDEFFQNVAAVSVSAKTGFGLEEFEAAVGKTVEEYTETYGVMLASSSDDRNPKKIVVDPNASGGERDKPLGGGEVSSALFSYLMDASGGFGQRENEEIDLEDEDCEDCEDAITVEATNSAQESLESMHI